MIEAVREVAKDIVDTKTWADVLIVKGDTELAKGNKLNAMAFCRMAEFYMDWDDAKDYLIIGGSRDTMNSRASIGKQMFLLKNARSIAAREITMKEHGADHCNVGNQQVAMDAILLWLEGLRRRDETLKSNS